VTPIGGNATLVLQTLTEGAKNAIGEREQAWQDAATLTGWLDLSQGTVTVGQDAKLRDSSHVFVCDWTQLPPEAAPETARAIVDGQLYSVQAIDDPMGLHQHLEVYLTRLGAGDQWA